jgi:hypothetical protein
MYVSQVVLQLVLGGAGMWMERGRAGLKDLEQATELDAAPADAQ